jgi:hypothetical protein
MRSISLYDRIRLWLVYCSELPHSLSVRLLLAVPLVAMIGVFGLNFRFIEDEGAFSIKVIEAFADDWPTPNIADYHSSTTPLPYLAFTFYGKIVGFEIWKLRLLTVVITYLTVNMFYGLCKHHNLPYPLVGTLLLLFFPYVFFHGFTIYTVNFALFFGVWSMRYYLLDEATSGQLLKGSMLATFAIYCRQEYLVLPMGMLLFEMAGSWWQESIREMGQRVRRLFVLGLPIILVLPLFWLWKGFTPPMQQGANFIILVPQHLNFLAIFVGFYFLPALIGPHVVEMLRSRRVTLVAGIILLPLYFGFPLVYSESPGRVAAATGIIAHGVDIVGHLLGNTVAFVAMLGLWAVGILIVSGEVVDSARSILKVKLLAMLAGFLFLIMLTPYVAERYYTVMAPVLILLLYRGARHRRMMVAWLMVEVGIAMGFSYWQIALKSFGPG